MTNCIFNGNHAAIVGGGISNFGSSTMTLINSTMSGNYAQAGGGFYNDNSNATITNSIIWNNTTDGLNNYQSTPTVNNSILQAAYGSSNLTTNPQFLNAANPIGEDNMWGTADDGLQISCNSSAYNAGTNTGAPITDFVGTARPQMGQTDIGAYESLIDIGSFTVNLTETVNCGSTTLTATPSVNLPSGTTYTFTGGTASTTNNRVYTSAGTYSVTVTTPNGCANTASQVLTLNPILTPSVVITVSPSNVIALGTRVTFTATPTHGGATPQYQWYLNDNPITTLRPLVNGDRIRCVLTTSLTCVTTTTANSNTITMTVIDCSTLPRLYVKPTASGTGDGSSWANAMGNLSDALNHVCGIKEIWVAGGTYKPSRDEYGTVVADNSRVFAMPNGMKIYGSFAGNESDLSQRTPSVMRANPTILSGDFSNNDVVTGSGSTLALANYGDNAYHIVAFYNTTLESRIDGFTITSGSGGGGNIYNKGLGNHGGGIWVSDAGTNVTIANCIITKNGGVYAGGVMNYNSSPTITNCVFDRNSASLFHGGGLYNHTNSRPTLANCVFSGNYARIVGGGVANFNGSTMTMTNSTISGNYAQAGGGFYNDNSNSTILNSITWNNTADGLNNYQSTPTVNNSILQAAFGSSNSTSNPQFVNTANPIGSDNLWGTADDGLRLACNSPARDIGTNTGAPTTDFANGATFNGTKDLGAYEKQDNDGCPIYVSTTACQSTTINNVSGDRFYNFFINNELVATLNPKGQNLGNVTVEVGSPQTTAIFNGGKHFGRGINVTSTVSPTADYTLCLFYKNTELAAFSAAMGQSVPRESLNMAWRSGGSSGCDFGNYAGVSEGLISNSAIAKRTYGISNDGFYLQFDLNHFTIFAPTVSVVLPVELLSFEGQNTEGGNLLIWKTAEEKNTSYFDVEASFDPSNGGGWRKVGEVKATGSNSTYEFLDKQLLNNVTYYRLKINDLDGKTTYSKTISLVSEKIRGGIKVYPNPTAEAEITVEMGQNTEGGLLIVNAIGQVVYQQRFDTSLGAGGLVQKVNISNWASGVYFVKSGEETVKFIKN
ncbi:MAG: T9SS type A sorting domain-containing protein [Saprospiraceae bacterium]|nr:T9SS type A sorting domain-containing protein [Saprospiraceae bacterium]